MYLRFKFSISKYVNIRNAVLLGMIGVVLLLLSNYLIESRWHGNYKNMRRMAFFVFIVIAFSSELSKYLWLKYSFYKLKTFHGPLEGIIYSIFISLGFAFVTTVLYAYDVIGTSDKMHNFILFLYMVPIANIVSAIAMGFFVGLAKTRKNTFIDSVTGLGVATFFHGLFYFAFITSDIRLLIFVAIGFAVISLTFLSKAVSLKIESKS
jgi:RsiW-degrading membrane proteinase PrsW (M82 family)